MKNISKQEIISNLHDKITQFKSNFSKNKETRKEIPELNFEINRDALKLFYKKKSDTEVQTQTQNQILPNSHTKIDEIYGIKNMPNEKISNQNQNIKNEDKIINNKNEKEEKQLNVGAKNDKNYKGINYNKIDNNIKKEYQNNNLNSNNIYNLNTNKKKEINTKNNYNTIGFIESNNIQNNQKNQDFKRPETSKENYIFENLDLNFANNNEIFYEGVKNNKKIEKRDKSAPKISINQKLNNFYSEKPLTDKKYDNIKDINHTSNYNQFFINENKNKSKTEELYQKLLMNFNINSSNNKRDKSFYNMNFTNNNNNKYIREDNPNKSYGQINIRDTNLYYESNGNLNNNYYNLQKRNTNYRNGLNLDHLKDLYSKKTEDSKRPTQSMFKSKMDMFYQELNEYKNANYIKKNQLNKNTYTKKNKYSSNTANNNNNYYYMANTQYNEYIKSNNITSNSNMNINQNIQNENNNVNKNSFNGNKIGYNEISAVKKYLKDLTKEEMDNLPMNLKTELKEIFNILYQKLSD